MDRQALAVAVVVALAVADHGLCQTPVSNPADNGPVSSPDAVSPGGHMGTWPLPAIVIDGERRLPLREEERVGRYGQPRRNTHWRCPRTRVYVVRRARSSSSTGCASTCRAARRAGSRCSGTVARDAGRARGRSPPRAPARRYACVSRG